ncbi:hypothetical protein D9615_010651 [Tricholomella constricta]|uniref:Uncharacterized protein n=1 Tax=Tricholomella constricta TaxID=117010 RepID=A0A8H5GIR9_9AGAR|nr:hypothetical protein D9615_010651 [Tricholomella constricta]
MQPFPAIDERPKPPAGGSQSHPKPSPSASFPFASTPSLPHPPLSVFHLTPSHASPPHPLPTWPSSSSLTPMTSILFSSTAGPAVTTFMLSDLGVDPDRLVAVVSSTGFTHGSRPAPSSSSSSASAPSTLAAPRTPFAPASPPPPSPSPPV